jgi:curved DNA-binding protein CbpA
MQLKDYYKTLRVPPAATHQQVKKSFRQLAHLYHPDKNPGNAVAEATFKEIKEAYETLADPGKREEYNYKRWYSRSVRDTFTHEVLAPASILRECTLLHEYLQTVNVLRVDYDGLSQHIRQLLNETNTAILQQAGDENVNRQIIEKIMQSASLLPFKYSEAIVSVMTGIAGNDQIILQEIRLFEQQQRQKNNWQKYKTLLVIALTILICWMIYTIGR